MKQNINLVSGRRLDGAKFPDTHELIPCNVDNFPADNPAYKKRDGFRCNDISLLDRISFDASFDSDLARIIAARVKDFSKQATKSDLTEEQMIRILRPSWVQTASEIKAYDEQVYQYLNTTQNVTQEKVDEVVQEVNEPSPVNVDSPDNKKNVSDGNE